MAKQQDGHRGQAAERAAGEDRHAGRLSRRALLVRAATLGLSAAATGVLLGACGDDDAASPTTGTVGDAGTAPLPTSGARDRGTATAPAADATATRAVGAAGAAAGAADPGVTARLRLIQAAPATPTATLYVNDRLVWENVSFGAASPYALVPSGDVRLRVAGSGVNATGQGPTVVSVNLEPNLFYSLVVSDLSPGSEEPLLATDNLVAPGPGQTRVRAIHAATGVEIVEVALQNRGVLFDRVQFKEATPYATLAPRQYTFEVRPLPLVEGRLVAFTERIEVADGGVYTVVALGQASARDEVAGTLQAVAYRDDA